MKAHYLLLFVSSILFLTCRNEPNNALEDKIKEVNPDSLLLALEDEIPPSQGFIKTYEGTIDGKLDITMVLINWGDGFLSGRYWYHKNKKSIELSGEVSDENRFQLAEGSFGKETGSFSGSMLDSLTLNGTWSDKSNTRTLPFEAKAVTPSADSIGWTGNWYLSEVWDNGTLMIENVTATTFDFALTIVRSSHVGTVEGLANINGNKAVFQLKDFDVKPCILKFEHKGNHIMLEQASSNYACGFGARAFAGGKYDRKYKRKRAQLRFGADEEDVFPSQIIHDSFKVLVGERFYQSFAFNMQQIEKSNAASKEIPNASVISGSIPGLLGSNEAIIIYDRTGKFWAAAIDTEGQNKEQAVLYFTNDENFKNKLPVAIDHWRDGFQQLRVVYK